MINLQI